MPSIDFVDDCSYFVWFVSILLVVPVGVCGHRWKNLVFVPLGKNETKAVENMTR